MNFFDERTVIIDNHLTQQSSSLAILYNENSFEKNWINNHKPNFFFQILTKVLPNSKILNSTGQSRIPGYHLSKQIQAPINAGPSFQLTNRIQFPAPEESRVATGPGMPVEPTWHEGCRATGEYAQLPDRTGARTSEWTLQEWELPRRF